MCRHKEVEQLLLDSAKIEHGWKGWLERDYSIAYQNKSQTLYIIRSNGITPNLLQAR